MEGDDPILIVRETSITYLVGETITLAYDSDSKCLLAQQESGSFVLVWPTGTRPINDNGRIGVELSGKGRAYVGDKITVVGGFEPWGKQKPAEFGIPAAATCFRNGSSSDAFIIGRIERIDAG